MKTAGPASSVISREDVALVVDEVLKTLRQRDAAPSGPNRTGGTPSAEANGETEGMHVFKIRRRREPTPPRLVVSITAVCLHLFNIYM